MSQMSDDYLHLPIQPASTSLTSHIQALDLLAARLSSLQTRAEWETRVPLNLKASVKGRVVNTSNIKINIGGEWWVDMTPFEGEQWIRRRKTALLEEHAKVLEGWRPGMTAGRSSDGASTSVKSNPQFDPVFRSPIKPQETEQEEPSNTTTDKPKGPGAVKAVKESNPSIPTTHAGSSTPNHTRDRPMTESKSEKTVEKTSNERPNITKEKVKEVIPEIPRSASTSKNKGIATSSSPTPSPASASAEMNKSLASVLSQFMENQNAIAQAKGTGTMPTGNPAEVMINEEGLPIHEIREDENGKLLSDLPTPMAVEGNPEALLVKEEKDDFWSADAIARREALRRKVFDDPSDSESDAHDAETVQAVEIEDRPTSPHINAIPPTPSSPTASSSLPEPPRRPSSSNSTLQPKSILKSSTPRKKSVSFDSSVPVPPDSDSPATTRIGGSTFPTPIINIETGIEEQAVPVLNAPKRSPNRATFGEPFAGFKPGFLGGGTTKGKIDPPKPVVLNEEPNSIPSLKPKGEVKIEAKPKKKSLFAQRTANLTEPEDENKPAFPPMSTSTHTSSVKNSIIERPNPTPSPAPEAGPSRLSTSKDRVEGKTAGVSSTVVERPVAVAGPSRLTSHLPDDVHEYSDNEDDEDDDDDSFYQDEDDEEEYDLDDALLAREVALAYHQNRAYSQLGQQNARSQRTAEEDSTNVEGFDESYIDGYGSEGEGEGGVVLGLPQISMLSPSGQRAMPSIINPTPDDLRRFVRVGKLDNGKLVLAPGEEGWSDEDEERDDVQERNRGEIKAALLGRGGPAVPKVQERRRGDEAIGLPPVIESAGLGSGSGGGAGAGAGGRSAAVHNVVQEKTNPGGEQASIPDPPKKVSRFKAARMG